MNRITYFMVLALFLAPFSGIHGSIVPQNTVNAHLKGYTQSEKERIQKDLKNIRELVFGNSPNQKGKKPLYLATAGGPGAAKSTILETYLVENGLENQCAYIDPDRVALRSMIHTYIPTLSLYNVSKRKNYGALTQEAYRQWRGGSNYIATTLLNEAALNGRDIAHGTTSTSSHIDNLYKGLKSKGYEIVLLLCGASDQSRQQFIQHRQTTQAFVQVEPRDVVAKGQAFPKRFKTYFECADKIYIYWTGGIGSESKLAAVYSKESGLDIKDQEALKQFTLAHGDLPLQSR